MDAPLFGKPSKDDGGATAHNGNSLAAILGRRKGREIAPAGTGDLGCGDVGRERRITEYAGIDHQRRDALRLDLALEISELDALGIERAQHRDRLVHIPPKWLFVANAA